MASNFEQAVLLIRQALQLVGTEQWLNAIWCVSNDITLAFVRGEKNNVTDPKASDAWIKLTRKHRKIYQDWRKQNG